MNNVKDLEAGNHGPNFKDQMNHRNKNNAPDSQEAASVVSAVMATPDSPRLLAEDLPPPSSSGDVIIPFADQVLRADTISPTQLRYERHIAELQNRLVVQQAEQQEIQQRANEVEAANKKQQQRKRRLCVITSAVAALLLVLAVSSPTNAPTNAPVIAPTKAPTKAPTNFPTKAPTKSPAKAPTQAPVNAQTKFPTKAPTQAPAKAPSQAPIMPTQVWLPPVETPVLAASAANLPDGRILLWASKDRSVLGLDPSLLTWTAIFNPVTGG
jgi:hypothetical protein